MPFHRLRKELSVPFGIFQRLRKAVLFILLTLTLLLGLACCSKAENGADGMNTKKVFLSFSSFEGGGPEYDVVLDTEIVTYKASREYNNANHKRLRGAGYKVIFTFTGVTPGETEMIIEERSPISDNRDRRYSVKVDNDLKVTIELLSVTDIK